MRAGKCADRFRSRAFADRQSLECEDDSLVGTPSFLPPESIEQARPCDGRADIFGLGVVLYRLLSGIFPFRGAPDFALQQILHFRPLRPSEIVPSVPTELEQICLRALDKRPRRRFATATQMAQELREWKST